MSMKLRSLEIKHNGIVSKSSIKIPASLIDVNLAKQARKELVLFIDGSKLGYINGIGYIAYTYSIDSYKRIADYIVEMTYNKLVNA